MTIKNKPKLSLCTQLLFLLEVHDIEGRLASIIHLLSVKGFTHIVTEQQTTQVSIDYYS